jgi:dephospho-CoA kinase
MTMRVIGLTGSIAMGKSTATAMFAERGVPAHDADRVVHRLYRGEAVAPIEAAFPGVTGDGAVDRTLLSARVVGDEAALRHLEAIVHPLVRASERRFLEEARAAGSRLVVLDIPLLFESGRAGDVDVVVVVSAGEAAQRERAMRRPGMTPEKFAALLARQVPDAEKRRRAHFVIDSSGEMDATGRQVDAILRALASTA